MTKENNNEKHIIEPLDELCEECKESDESVIHNLMLTGFKVCNSCRVSKTIFPFESYL